MMYHNDPYLNDFENRIEAARQRENELLSASDFGPEIEIEIVEDDEHGDSRFESDEYDEDDGQPDEYTEWQDYMGGDDWDHGQYDHDYYDGGVDF
tara:strand:+ start:55 stop:339 length:285 start_codon:yes stop_codon:yes gene_type:complete